MKLPICKKFGQYNVVIAKSNYKSKWTSDYELRFYDDTYHDAPDWKEYGQPCASGYDLDTIALDESFLKGESGLDIWAGIWVASAEAMKEISNWAFDVRKALNN